MSMQATQRNPSWMVSKNFKASEVCCKHCGVMGMKLDFIALLQEFRDYLGAPVVINSGYRCSLHPAELSKPPGKVGRHRLGCAVDIRSPGMSLEDLYSRVEKFGKFLGVGVSIHGGFIHCDQRERKARWQYDVSGRDIPWDGRWQSLQRQGVANDSAQGLTRPPG